MQFSYRALGKENNVAPKVGHYRAELEETCSDNARKVGSPKVDLKIQCICFFLYTSVFAAVYAGV